MRKVCVIIQSLLPRRPNRHSSYGYDRHKHRSFLTLPRRKNIVNGITNTSSTSCFGSMRAVHPSTWLKNRLAVIDAVQSRYFNPSTAGGANHAYLQYRPWRSSHKGVQVSENSELFKKLEPGAQFHWERISSSRVAPRADPKRHPPIGPVQLLLRLRKDRDSLRRALQHSWKNSASPQGLWRLSVTGFDARLGKATSSLCFHIASSVKDRPRKISVARALQVGHFRDPILGTLITDLPVNHRFSTSPQQRGEGLYKPMVERICQNRHEHVQHP